MNNQSPPRRRPASNSPPPTPPPVKRHKRSLTPLRLGGGGGYGKISMLKPGGINQRFFLGRMGKFVILGMFVIVGTQIGSLELRRHLEASNCHSTKCHDDQPPNLRYRVLSENMNTYESDIEEKRELAPYKSSFRVDRFDSEAMIHKTAPRNVQLPAVPQQEPQRPKERKFEQRKVKRIALLGERNSGTRWIYSELQRCFGHHEDLELKSHLTRWKHWFQPEWDNIEKHTPTLVIAAFRNPYEWVEAMRVTPHHAPAHSGKKHGLHWQDFVTTPWTMPRPQRDLALSNKDGPVCYEHFKYNELVSCVEGNKTDPEYQALFDPNTGLNRFGKKITDPDPQDFSAHKPVYELRLDGSGEPYDSILGLRADKIRNFLSVAQWDWVADSIPVQYENLLHNGTDFLLTMIEQYTGLQRSCKASPPNPKKKQRMLDPSFVRWMNNNVDWTAEKLIGYKQRDGLAHRVSVLGERHTGESTTLSQLKKCFPGKRIDDKLIREKHWFQPLEAMNENHTPTLVLYNVRDPFSWVEELRRKPLLAPQHIGSMHWLDFVTTPWTMPRPQRDIALTNKTGPICTEKFHYHELIGCVEGRRDDPEYNALFNETGHNVYGNFKDDPHDFSAHRPMYELRQDGSGQPYPSVLHMRADKIKSSLYLAEWHWITDVVTLKFEDAMKDGLERAVQAVEDHTGWTRQCSSVMTGDEFTRKNLRASSLVGLPADYVKWMNDHVDWESEASIGYQKRYLPTTTTTAQEHLPLFEGMKFVRNKNSKSRSSNNNPSYS